METSTVETNVKPDVLTVDVNLVNGDITPACNIESNAAGFKKSEVDASASLEHNEAAKEGTDHSASTKPLNIQQRPRKFHTNIRRANSSDIAATEASTSEKRIYMDFNETTAKGYVRPALSSSLSLEEVFDRLHTDILRSTSYESGLANVEPSKFEAGVSKEITETIEEVPGNSTTTKPVTLQEKRRKFRTHIRRSKDYLADIEAIKTSMPKAHNYMKFNEAAEESVVQFVSSDSLSLEELFDRFQTGISHSTSYKSGIVEASPMGNENKSGSDTRVDVTALQISSETNQDVIDINIEGPSKGKIVVNNDVEAEAKEIESRRTDYLEIDGSVNILETKGKICYNDSTDTHVSAKLHTSSIDNNVYVKSDTSVAGSMVGTSEVYDADDENTILLSKKKKRKFKLCGCCPCIC